MSLLDTVSADIAKLNLDWAAYTASLSPTPPNPAPNSGLWTEHNSAYLGTKSGTTVTVDSNGNPTNPPLAGSSFNATLLDPTHGLMQWGDSVEHHAVLSNNGEQWGAVEFYGSATNSAIAYPEEITRCDWANLDTGVVRDMTFFTTGPVGGIMCPQILPTSGNFRIRQWGWIWNNLQSKGGVRDHRFYWQCDYQFGSTIVNNAWQGAAPNNATSRQGIHYMEAWWDPTNGWEATNGQAPGAPYDSANNPVVPAVTYAGWNAFGRLAGTLWRYDRPTYKVALRNAL